MLSQILKADPSRRDAVTGSPASTEMVLRTYHLTNLRVSEAGKAKNVIAILMKLLPSGSSMNTDVAANSLHILTTPASHQAIWDYLSAVDIPDTAATPPAGVPEDVKAALKKLADASDQSPRVLAEINALKSDVSAAFASIDARQRAQMIRFALIVLGFTLIFVVTFFWMIRRRPVATADAGPSTAVALAPEQLAHALAPAHDKMRGEMLGLLNEVAIKLQAQHEEQQKLVQVQQLQIEDARQALASERQQFISQAGTMVVQAVERVDATTTRLAKQQDKVAELVQELQSTVKELDATKDNLRTREVELEQERAKIAALSILLEEGGSPVGFSLPSVPGHDGPAPALAEGAATPVTDDSHVETNGDFSPCTNLAKASPLVLTPRANGMPAPADLPRFTFLPPDHPES